MTLLIWAAIAALPAVATSEVSVSIHRQAIRIEGRPGKHGELVTVDYDRTSRQFVIGGDVGALAPARCSLDTIRRRRAFRCPSQGQSELRISTHDGDDRVRLGTNRSDFPGDTHFSRVVFLATVDAGAGDDQVESASAADLIRLGPGNDRATVGRAEFVQLFGDGGDDRLFGGSGDDALIGGSGDDRLRGRAGRDSLQGGAGEDAMHAGGGGGSAEGGPGDDRFAGGGDDDVLFAGPGRDTAHGAGGRDLLDGGSGEDRLDGGPSNDLIGGGYGADLLIGGPDLDWLDGGAGRPDRCRELAGQALTEGCELR